MNRSSALTGNLVSENTRAAEQNVTAIGTHPRLKGPSGFSSHVHP